MKLNPKALDQMMAQTYITNKNLKPPQENSKVQSDNTTASNLKGKSQAEEPQDKVSLTGATQAELEAHREKIKTRLSNGYYSKSTASNHSSAPQKLSSQDQKELEIARRVLSNFEAPKGFSQKAPQTLQSPKIETSADPQQAQTEISQLSLEASAKSLPNLTP